MGSLVGHGFLDVSLNPLLTNICDALPHTSDIARLGPAETDISGDRYRFLDRALDRPGTRVGWTAGTRLDRGSYGTIFRAKRIVLVQRPDGIYVRQEAAKEVAIKKVLPRAGDTMLASTDITAYTSEALLHILAWRALQQTATPWAIPRPYEVFGERTVKGAPGWQAISFCMNLVRAETFMTFLEKHWVPTSRAENTRVFLDILGQLAYILHILQVGLRFNHRDVKINNIMVRRRKSGHTHLQINDASMESNYAVTLIDFGFACLGCPKQLRASFQAGSWFDKGDICYKVGRDLAQLIFCIHCYYPLDIYLTDTIAAVIHRWMQTPWRGTSVDMLQGFTKKGYPSATGVPEFHRGVYRFLKHSDVDPIACAPARIFQEVCQLLPTI